MKTLLVVGLNKWSIWLHWGTVEGSTSKGGFMIRQVFIPVEPASVVKPLRRSGASMYAHY